MEPQSEPETEFSSKEEAKADSEELSFEGDSPQHKAPEEPATPSFDTAPPPPPNPESDETENQDTVADTPQQQIQDLFVGPINTDVTEGVLREAFSKYGEVIKIGSEIFFYWVIYFIDCIYLHLDRKDSYAFVTMKGDWKEAKKNITGTYLVPTANKTVNVQISARSSGAKQKCEKRAPGKIAIASA